MTLKLMPVRFEIFQIGFSQSRRKRFANTWYLLMRKKFFGGEVFINAVNINFSAQLNVTDTYFVSSIRKMRKPGIPLFDTCIAMTIAAGINKNVCTLMMSCARYARKFGDRCVPILRQSGRSKRIHRISMEAKSLRAEKCDFNQNLIEPSRSFTQLCNMINQLEKDSNIEIAECNQLAIDAKCDDSLEQALERYSEQVSDRNIVDL